MPFLLSRRLKFFSFAASLIVTVLVISAYALPTVRAANITISNQASCEIAGGYWESSNDSCDFFSAYTVGAGDTLTLNVAATFQSGLTNNGMLNIDGPSSVLIDVSFLNNSGAQVVLTGYRLRINATATNYGTITEDGSALGIEIFPSSSSLTNYGVVNADIDNDGTVTNNCPGVINGSVTGTGTFIENCPRTATPVPPTATYTSTPSNTPVPPTATYTNTSTNTAIPPTATYTNTATNTAVPPSLTPTNTATNTTVPPTATFTPSKTPTNTATPTPSGFAKAQFNHGDEISVTKSERPSIIFQYGATTGKPLTNARIECSISGQATFVTPVSNNGFTTVNSTSTTLSLSGRGPLQNGQNYTATFKVNPGATVGQISTLTCTLVSDNSAPVSDTLNIRVR